MNKRLSNSNLYQLGNLRPLVIAVMQYQGKDFTTCEICKGYLPPNKFDIHHTKYNGATLNGLQIVCHKCNVQPQNRFLS